MCCGVMLLIIIICVLIFYLNACVSYLCMSSAYMRDKFDYIYIHVSACSKN